jgi:hypothetical protein
LYVAGKKVNTNSAEENMEMAKRSKNALKQDVRQTKNRQKE